MLVAAEPVACDNDNATTAHAATARAASPQYDLLIDRFTAVSPWSRWRSERTEACLRRKTVRISSRGRLPPPRCDQWRTRAHRLTLHRTRSEAARDVALGHDQHDSGRNQGDHSGGHDCAPIGRIVA